MSFTSVSMTSFENRTMAEAKGSVRNEWRPLLVRLKCTVEGLLATQSFNVWSTYGGLERLCKDVDCILNHKLRVTQGQYGNCFDYWNFVRGLRWLNPMLSPSIEHLSRVPSDAMFPDVTTGQVWVRQSLLNHNLCAQLQGLVSNQQHLLNHYEESAFLAQADYFEALVICLQAVEQNRPALLADINPSVLTERVKRRPKLRPSHVRSQSLPINHVTENIMIRRSRTEDRLAPPLLSPKSESVLSTSFEYARASTGSSPESAKDALLQVLQKSGSPIDLDDDHITFSAPKSKEIDPLMNIEITSPLESSSRKRSGSHTGLFGGSTSSLEKANNYRNSMKRSQSQYTNNNNVQHPLKSQREDDVTRSDNSLAVRPRAESTATIRSTYSTKSNELLDRILNVDEEEEEMEEDEGETLAIVESKSRNGLSNQDGSKSDLRSVNKRTESRDSGIYSLPTESAAGTPSTSIAATSIGSQLPRSQSHTQGLAAKRKYTHQRSVSDFALPKESISSPRLMSVSPDSAEYNARRHNSLQESSDSFFRRPQEGQSLVSYLSSQDFHTCAELDKENAHFNISETLIAAIETMKWNQVIRPQRDSDHEMGDSDEEIQQLKQRIRIRRRERLTEKARGFPAFSDGKTDTMTTTTGSDSPHSSSHYSSFSPDSSCSSSDEFHDTEISDIDGSETTSTSNLTSLKESGLSLSLASLYSDADLQKNIMDSEKFERRDMILDKKELVLEAASSIISAESVALNLLKRFSEKQLPKASDLVWLVSEQDAPQALLPLPNSYPVSPDEGENSDIACGKQRTRLRGNLEWAPPRPQIIFNIHPVPKRKVVLAKQNYRCAGCGAKVEPGYMKRYHYCEYLGKYFCPRCHTNIQAYIPGRILRKWDFTLYAVSNFSADLINRILPDPLFNIQDINSALYRKVRVLDMVREARIQLVHLKIFLQTCRIGFPLYEQMEKCPPHWTTDIHIYSVMELVQIKKGEHLPRLRRLVTDCITHVSQCPLCQAKGFICELCNNDRDVIFPFEISRVTQCPVCHACYHKTCYIPDRCPKCSRIEARKHSLAIKALDELEPVNRSNPETS